MKLEDLLTDPAHVAKLSAQERAAVRPQVTALLVRVSALLTALDAETITTTDASTNGDAVLTADEVAALMRQNRRWVLRTAKRESWDFVVPNTGSRKVKLFRKSGVDQLLARQGGAR